LALKLWSWWHCEKVRARTAYREKPHKMLSVIE
jgi:hypothetical protein